MIKCDLFLVWSLIFLKAEIVCDWELYYLIISCREKLITSPYQVPADRHRPPSRFPCCVYHICHFGFVMNWQIQIQIQIRLHIKSLLTDSAHLSWTHSSSKTVINCDLFLFRLLIFLKAEIVGSFQLYNKLILIEGISHLHLGLFTCSAGYAPKDYYIKSTFSFYFKTKPSHCH